jgi:hypothetical protein
MTAKTKQQNKDMSDDETILKFQELQVDKVYIVKGLSNKINSKFGVSYILTVQKESSKKLMKVWSTNHLVNYIEDEEPTKKWKFTVMLNDNDMKYPEIEGYSRYKVTMYSDSE